MRHRCFAIVSLSPIPMILGYVFELDQAAARLAWGEGAELVVVAVRRDCSSATEL